MKAILEKYPKAPMLMDILKKKRHKYRKCEGQKHALTLCREGLKWNAGVRFKFKGKFENRVVLQEEERKVRRKEVRKVKRRKTKE